LTEFSRFLVGLFVCGCLAFGQGPSGEVTGAVTDPSNAVVGGATVTITNVSTNVRRTVSTNSAGIYSAPSLPPGPYSVQVSFRGFRNAVRSNLDLQVDQIARVDFKLEVGDAAQSVEVSAVAPSLDQESATVGTVVETTRIEELPLNGRNYLQLTSLVPGATTYGPQNGVEQTRTGGDRSNFVLNVEGERFEFNHYSLDGVENTEPNWGGYWFQPSVDALQEFKVETATYNAEYGHGASQVNVATKSGANEFHGSLWEFLRNADLDAQNFFQPGNVPVPAFKRNQFGGTIGGPVIIPKVVNGKNKLFFFFDYEGQRLIQGQTSLANLPLAQERTGNFSGYSSIIYDPATRVLNAAGTANVSVSPFPGNIIPASRIAPQSAFSLQNFYPLPNNSVNNSIVNDYLNNENIMQNNNQEMARVDWAQSAKSSFVFRMGHENEPQFTPGNVPNTGTDNVTTTWQGMAGYTLVLGPNKVNEFKAGYDWIAALNHQADAYNPARDFVTQLGIPTTNIPFFYGSPVYQITDFSNVGDNPNGPYMNYDSVFELTDNFSWNVGKHSIKFGADFVRSHFDMSGADVSRGRFTWNGQYTSNIGAPPTAQNALADFLLGDMTESEGQIGLVVSEMRDSYGGFFVQDQWRVNSKLTINYGLRYELQPGFNEKHDHLMNVDFAWNNSITPTFVRAGTGDPYQGNPPFPFPANVPFVRDGRFGDTIWRTDYGDFGPRLGIAYSLNDKTVLRIGGGIYYVHEEADAAFDVMRNQPYTIRVALTSNGLVPNLNWANVYPNLTISTLSPAWYWKDPTPRVAQWSANVQRQLTRALSLEVGYVGSAGIYLDRDTYYNEMPPGPPGNTQARRPFPVYSFFQLVEGASHSSYDALQARLQQRLTNGLTVLSSFSWEKSIDNGSGSRNIGSDTLTPSNVYDLAAERGLSAFNFGTRWTTSFLYEIPVGKGKQVLANANRLVDALLGGWQLGGIYTLQGGFPFSVFCASNATYQNTDSTCRADATGASPYLSSPAPSHWYNTTAFVNRLNFTPGVGPYTFGNSGRDNVVGPGISELDASLAKWFPITERAKLEFRAELFNAPNHPIFSNPAATVGSPSNGVVSSTLLPSRQIQFALKLQF
jgi:hypothetical protein